MKRRNRVLIAGFAVAVGLLLAASSASASFHLTKIREVYLGSSAASNDAFVELQMHSAGQNLVAGHEISTYTASGALLGTFTIPSNVPNGDTQRTVLIGDSAVPGRDAAYDVLTETVSSYGAGGAACLPDASPPDCVSWGSFSGGALLPGATGTPALGGGIPVGSSITRTIAPNCPTLLEEADDRNNSSADFALSGPSPRGNAVVPTEKPCGTPTPACANPTLSGTFADDFLKGTKKRDVIDGLDGADTIIGRSGNDVLCGGKGNDTVVGKNGHDVVCGGEGDDIVRGGTGRDRLFGGPGADALFSRDGERDVVDPGFSNRIDNCKRGSIPKPARCEKKKTCRKVGGRAELDAGGTSRALRRG